MDFPNASVRLFHSSLSYSRQPALLPTMVSFLGFVFFSLLFLLTSLSIIIFSLQGFRFHTPSHFPVSFSSLFPGLSHHSSTYPSCPQGIANITRLNAHFSSIIASRKYSPTRLYLIKAFLGRVQRGARPGLPVIFLREIFARRETKQRVLGTKWTR